MNRRLTKAVFPVAGMGSRFLPATKASPKEMMPIVDKPLIQYAVEEAVAAGVKQMVFITGKNKRAIEDHFDKAYELETELEARGKMEMLDLVRNVLPKSVDCIYIRQPEPLGLGHAVLCARPVVGDEPFAVILADDLIDADPPVLSQMSEVAFRLDCSVLGVQEIPADQTRQYGIVAPKPLEPGIDQVQAIVEKPDPSVAPSRIAVVGRYILTPRIFGLLEQVKPGAGGEIQLTDAIAALLKEERVVAHRFKGTRYDCGSKIGYLAATVAYGRRHAEVGKAFEALLKSQTFGSRAASRGSAPSGGREVMVAEQAWKILREAELVCDAGTVRSAMERLAGEISQKLAECNPLVLVVMRGGVFFAGQLLPLLRFPLELDYVHASRYGNELSGRQLEWKSFPPENLRGRCVLVLDDILDAGDTLAGIRKHVMSSGAESCYTAVLTEKQTGARKPIVPDFVGLTLPNRYVFGCGLDVSGAWRNLPEIYALKEGN